MITACMLTAFKVVVSLLSTVKATNCHTPCDSVWVSMQKYNHIASHTSLLVIERIKASRWTIRSGIHMN